MSVKTEKFIGNVLKGRNLKAKGDLKQIIEGKIARRIHRILQKDENRKI